MRAGALHHAGAARADTSQHAARSETVTLPTTRPSSTTTPQAAPLPSDQMSASSTRVPGDRRTNFLDIASPTLPSHPVSAGWRSDLRSFMAHLHQESESTTFASAGTLDPIPRVRSSGDQKLRQEDRALTPTLRLLDDQRRHHAVHPMWSFDVRKDVAVECPDPRIPCIHQHVEPLSGRDHECVGPIAIRPA